MASIKKTQQNCLGKNSPSAKCIKIYHLNQNMIVHGNGNHTHERQRSIEDHLLQSS
jgi:hypothetical protein